MPPRVPIDPCSSCNKNINKNHRYLLCSLCSKKVHYRCNFLNLIDYKKIKKSQSSFSCYNCINDTLPFTSLTDNEFLPLLRRGTILHEGVNSNIFSPSPQIQHHINKLNTYLNQNFSDPTSDVDDDSDSDSDMVSPINCNYFNYDEFADAKFDSSKSFSILHLNIHSIQKHIESLRALLLTLHSETFEFDIIAISESKIAKNIAPMVDINISNYHDPISTPTEASKGGVLLYVNNKIPNFKPRNDLNIYSPKVLESAFIEIINPKKANTILGVVYRHPTLDVELFNCDHIRPLVTKLNLEKNKNVCIAGDFNINLLNLTNHSASSEFFDIMSSNHLLPLISLPTKLNSGNDTLIDNIYTNFFNPDTLSGNITFNVSDGHLPSFVIIPLPNQNHLPKKHNIYKHDTKIFNPESPNFFNSINQINQELSSFDWNHAIQADRGDANLVLENLDKTLAPIIEKYIPLKK